VTIRGISIQGSDVTAVLREMLHPSSHLGDRQWGFDFTVWVVVMMMMMIIIIIIIIMLNLRPVLYIYICI